MVAAGKPSRSLRVKVRSVERDDAMRGYVPMHAVLFIDALLELAELTGAVVLAAEYAARHVLLDRDLQAH